MLIVENRWIKVSMKQIRNPKHCDIIVTCCCDKKHLVKKSSVVYIWQLFSELWSYREIVECLQNLENLKNKISFDDGD